MSLDKSIDNFEKSIKRKVIKIAEVFGYEDNRKKLDPNKNYCLDCGACCMYFKVYFPKEESSEFGGQVPKEYVEPFKGDKSKVNMIGRGKFNDKVFCKSLTGEIGKSVFCTIYENRSSVCRAFEVISEEGYQNPRCAKARKAAGLKPELE
jgi:Fe-S-cluster containining protein